MNTLQFLTSLSEVFTWLLRGSARAAVAVIAVLIVRAILRRRLLARWRYTLWIAVPVAMLLPRLPQTPVGVSQYTDSEVVHYVLAFDAATNSTPVLPAAKPKIAAPEKSHRFTWQEIGGMVWLTGAALLSAFWVAVHWRTLRQIRQSAQSPQRDIAELAGECGVTIGVRRLPEIVISPAIPSPAVTGLFRSQLLLPVDLSERFSQDELRLMLLHELAHIRRGDLLMNHAATAMLALHWFNPLLWFGASCMRTDRESACDASVLSSSATDRREAYGDTLLKLQAELSTGHGFPAFVGIFENTRRIRDRLIRIATFRRGGAAWGLAAIAIAAGLLACLAAESPIPPVTPVTENTVPPAPLSLEQRLRRVAIKGQQVQISSVIRQLSDDEFQRLGMGTPRSVLEKGELGVFHLVSVTDPHGIAVLNSRLPQVTDASASPKKLPDPLATGSIPLLGGNENEPSPRITTRTGQRAVIEIIREFRYPIEWKDPDPLLPQTVPTPVSFETRNLGVTLEVLPMISSLEIPIQQTIIDFEISPQLVFFTGFEDAKTEGGFPIRKPKFSETKNKKTKCKIYNGQTLVLVGELEVPDENPWGVKDVSSITDVVSTHRAVILWLATVDLINSRGEPGFSNTALGAELFEPRDWQFTNMPIEQCIAHFSSVSRVIDPSRRGLNIVLGKPAGEKRNVSIDLRRTNLVNALELSAKAAGFRVEEDGDNTVVLTP